MVYPDRMVFVEIQIEKFSILWFYPPFLVSPGVHGWESIEKLSFGIPFLSYKETIVGRNLKDHLLHDYLKEDCAFAWKKNTGLYFLGDSQTIGIPAFGNKLVGLKKKNIHNPEVTFGSQGFLLFPTWVTAVGFFHFGLAGNSLPISLRQEKFGRARKNPDRGVSCVDPFGVLWCFWGNDELTLQLLMLGCDGTTWNARGHGSYENPWTFH